MILEKGLGRVFSNVLINSPDDEAIIFYDWRITFRELDNQINKFVNFYIDKGFKKGDKIAIVSRNCPEYIFALFACYRLGIIAVKNNWRLSASELMEQFDFCEVNGIIYQPNNIEDEEIIVKKYQDKIPVYVFHKDKYTGSELMDLVKDYSIEDNGIEIHEEDIAHYSFTSGTTGQAKVVVHTQYSILKSLANFEGIAFKMEKENRVFVSQLHHAAIAIVYASFLLGCKLVLMDRFDIDYFMDTLVKEEISEINIIPLILKQMIIKYQNGNYDLRKLKYIKYSSCPMPRSLLSEAMKLFNCQFSGYYGTTETSGTFLVLSSQDHEHHLTSIGKPNKNVDVKILDDNNKECQTNQIGEICVKYVAVMNGYLKQDNLTKQKIIDEYYHTGDMGYVDEEGYIMLAGRKDNLIISGGENIYPNEITNVLMKIPDMMETVSIGVPDSEWGEHIKTFVVLKKDSKLTSEDIINYCKENISHYKCPKEVMIVDSLPKNSAGKILVSGLR